MTLLTYFVSVPFGMERYKFHLNVYNQYKVLKDVKKIELGPGENQYLKLKKIIKSAKINVGCGRRKSRKKLFMPKEIYNRRKTVA